MKEHRSVTGFYLETLILIVVFLLVILVLMQVFGLAQTQSAQAKQLTEAVILAGNAAESAAASRSPEELLGLMNENQNAGPMENTTGVTARYAADLTPEAQGMYRVDVTWLPEAAGTGTMVHSAVEVYCGERTEPIYRLETQTFHSEMSA